jgi:hypothetical protein
MGHGRCTGQSKTEKLPHLERTKLNVLVPKPQALPEGMPRLPLLQLIQGGYLTLQIIALLSQLVQDTVLRAVHVTCTVAGVVHCLGHTVLDCARVQDSRCGCNQDAAKMQ